MQLAKESLAHYALALIHAPGEEDEVSLLEMVYDLIV